MAREQSDAGREPHDEVERAESVQDMVLATLLDKVAGERFPSPSMLNRIEAMLTPQRRRDYAEILLEKVREDVFPSADMLKRLTRLAC